MKGELPENVLNKWFKSETPAMSVFHSDTTQAMVKKLKGKK